MRKKRKITFICSECGKIHYRVEKSWYEDRDLYCTYCLECSLMEASEITPEILDNIIKKEGVNPWVKIRSEGTDSKKSRLVKFLSYNNEFITTQDYNVEEKIIYHFSTIQTISIITGYNEKDKPVFKQIFKK